MTEYRVTWGVEFDADSPREAAELALRVLMDTDPENLAKVFEVTETYRRPPTVMIDLSPGALNGFDVDVSTDQQEE